MDKETKNKYYWSAMVTSADQNGNPHEVEFRLYISQMAGAGTLPAGNLRQNRTGQTAEEAEVFIRR